MNVSMNDMAVVLVLLVIWILEVVLAIREAKTPSVKQDHEQEQNNK
jgi:succinate dehydrogenase hydrophobic anchor subunit